MSLIIAVFIVIILLLIRGGDTLQSRMNAVSISKKSDARDKFCDKYTDVELEDQCNILISKYCASTDCESINRLRIEIIKNVGEIEFTGNMLLCAIMAEKCKVPMAYALGGFHDSITYGGGITRLEALKRSEERFKFLKWYNEKLKTNGMDDDELYFLSQKSTIGSSAMPDYSKKVRVSDMTEHSPGGVYFWGSVLRPRFHYGRTL